MPDSSRPSRQARWACALSAALLVCAAPATAQMMDRWQTTHDRYDAAFVQAQLDAERDRLSHEHGAIAQTMWSMRAELAAVPYDVTRRPMAPAVPHMRHRVEAAHLIHHQAVAGGGSLGPMHGSTAHPSGLGWFPHSMFAQGGRVYGVWGYGRLLEAVSAHAERHAGG